MFSLKSTEIFRQNVRNPDVLLIVSIKVTAEVNTCFKIVENRSQKLVQTANNKLSGVEDNGELLKVEWGGTKLIKINDEKM
jgi:hypothetical protein